MNKNIGRYCLLSAPMLATLHGISKHGNWSDSSRTLVEGLYADAHIYVESELLDSFNHLATRS